MDDMSARNPLFNSVAYVMGLKKYNVLLLCIFSNFFWGSGTVCLFSMLMAACVHGYWSTW